MNRFINIFIVCAFAFINNAFANSACQYSSYTNETKSAKYSNIININCLYEKGNPEQKLTLARKYFTGHKINKNIYLAIKFYKKAILEDNIEATVELADLYLSNDMNEYLENKKITNDDRKEKAFILYSIAAYNQNQEAIKKLEILKKEYKKEKIKNDFIPIIVKWINNPEKRNDIYRKI